MSLRFLGQLPRLLHHPGRAVAARLARREADERRAPLTTGIGKIQHLHVAPPARADPPGDSPPPQACWEGMDHRIRRALEHDRTIDITTTGRTTGHPRRVEIWIHNLDGRLYLTGTPGRRDWYANLGPIPSSADTETWFRASPLVEVEILDAETDGHKERH